MIISRELYETAILISQQVTEYQPGLPMHESALAAGIARVEGKVIELTHKGEQVILL